MPEGRCANAELETNDEFDLGGVYLRALDRTGRAIEESWACLYVDAWEPSALGVGLVDLTLDVHAFAPPGRGQQPGRSTNCGSPGARPGPTSGRGSTRPPE
ncbi:hypothetical protein NLX86_17485 [Streptomyces sp. A3M-1-3]|uniref:hypothetical protein n=1 Tax=Streptomyces sp. A3M-1-3 TaxID=2962044 RepID=UPI0020B84A8F|nr:hypothetical protein [Streptomyces sp. A3M-1-3]MCP3819823.1 hypothetical protein [Streptomyces sp. A3M-1-3]